MTLRVLYEDNHVIAVHKPVGVLVQADKTGDVCLLDEVKTYIKETYHKPGNVFVGVVHRLDRPVEGIVIFARTSKGASRLSEQIRNRTFKKTYHALVEGTPQKASDTLIHYIKKNTKTNIVVAYEKECPESLYAELSYEVVKSNTLYSLIAIKLKTGRPHQIRAQMSAIGCPIVGDTKYGSSTAYHVGSLALCATEVSFQLPTKEEIKTISIPIPEKWNTYI